MIEKFEKLQKELNGLRNKGVALRSKRADLMAAYEEKLQELQSQSILGDEKTVEKLQKQAWALLDQTRLLERRIEAFGQSGSIERCQEAVANAPESDVHKLAKEVCTEGWKAMEDLQSEAGKVLNEILPKLRGDYFKAVGCLGEKIRDLYDLAHQLNIAEQCLPESDRQAAVPMPAPYSQHLELEGQDLADAYGPRPFFNPKY